MQPKRSRRSTLARLSGAGLAAVLLLGAAVAAGCTGTTQTGGTPSGVGTSASKTTIIDEGQVQGSEPMGPLDIPPAPPKPADDRYTIVPYDTDATPSGPQVPDVMGLGSSAAADKLRGAGYTPTVRYGASTTDVAPGVVFAQEPAAGDYRSRGITVVIWVSTGAPKGGAPYPGPSN